MDMKELLRSRITETLPINSKVLLQQVWDRLKERDVMERIVECGKVIGLLIYCPRIKSHF